MNTSPRTLWSDIANHKTPGTNLANWLFSTSTHNPHIFHYSPTVQASVKVWRTLHNTKWSQVPTKPLHIPLNTLKLLTPDLTLPTWITDRVTYTQELRDLTTCKSFSQIGKDLNAPSKDFLTYLRLQNCLKAHTSLEGKLPLKLWNYFFTEHYNTKGTSLIYSFLQEKKHIQQNQTSP